MRIFVSPILTNTHHTEPYLILTILVSFLKEERDAVNVAVHTQDGKFLVFSQTKYAIPGATLSPVGGFINDRETPFDAARREVWEELGVGSRQTKEQLFAGKQHKKNPFPTTNAPPTDEHGLLEGSVAQDEPDWFFLGRYRSMANRGGGFLYAYLVMNAVPLVEGGGTKAYTSEGDNEDQNLLLLSKEEVEKAVEKGRFQEVKWAATMSLSLATMQRRGR